MKIVQDFFNKVAIEIRSKYFPEVKYYRDNKRCADATYAIELFNNGCLTYDSFISRLCKFCKASQEEVASIVNKYIQVN